MKRLASYVLVLAVGCGLAATASALARGGHAPAAPSVYVLQRRIAALESQVAALRYSTNQLEAGLIALRFAVFGPHGRLAAGETIASRIDSLTLEQDDLQRQITTLGDKLSAACNQPC